MKKLLILLAVSFSFAIVNAQSKTNAEMKSETKTCDHSKSSKKACCSKSGDAKKACCDKSATGAKCAGSVASAEAYSKNVGAKEFMAYADRFPSEQIIDVRTKKEVKENGMIPGAINIDFNNSDEFKTEMNKLDRNVATMIYCKSGKRSEAAVDLMKKWGFTKIYNLEGGYDSYLVEFPAKKAK